MYGRVRLQATRLTEIRRRKCTNSESAIAFLSKMLKDYLRDHDDVAVRAIVLDSQNPKESFAMPAAHQHLRSAPGLPYFVVVNAKGKAVFKGSDVAKLLKKIDKKR